MPPSAQALRSKLPATGTTIFTVMSALAAEHRAINLSQGFPDFLCSEFLLERAAYYMHQGLNQYAPMPGILPLRQRIAEKVRRLYDADYDPESEITITAGGTQALYAAIAATVHEGDEVLLFEPAYDSYAPAVELHRGVPVYVELSPPDFRIDWDKVRRCLNRRTRLIIINSPHNPTGAMIGAGDLQELQRLIADTDILVLSDEVYEHLVFDGRRHESVMRYPELAARSFVVFSFGKTYHNTGWKMGYCLAPAALMAEFRKVHQFMVFSVNTPLQYAYADMMEDPAHYEQLSSFYEEKRNMFLQLISDLPFSVRPAEGSYFQCAGYEQISNEADRDFAIRLTREAGVAVIPVSAFYRSGTDHRLIRFCFAKKQETLEEAARRLRAYLRG
ncbi:MAG: methionine aminotransferase [Chitinophagales bacterium]|nr:methionine aminotransferase [Chitinophagales bacterium]MDW8394361.1 methionine aminotransferase [Chitinophagales bacterium]